jgi:hypothetical protein
VQICHAANVISRLQEELAFVSEVMKVADDILLERQTSVRAVLAIASLRVPIERPRSSQCAITCAHFGENVQFEYVCHVVLNC